VSIICPLGKIAISFPDRACDPREGTRGSGIIHCRKLGIMAKIELRIPFQRPIRFPPETDYPRASRSFPRIAGSGNEIGKIDNLSNCQSWTKASHGGLLCLHNSKSKAVPSLTVNVCMLTAFLSIILWYISRGRVIITLRHQNLGSIKL
jgi:hypothetical protein